MISSVDGSRSLKDELSAEPRYSPECPIRNLFFFRYYYYLFIYLFFFFGLKFFLVLLSVSVIEVLWLLFFFGWCCCCCLNGQQHHEQKRVRTHANELIILIPFFRGTEIKTTTDLLRSLLRGYQPLQAFPDLHPTCHQDVHRQAT